VFLFFDVTDHTFCSKIFIVIFFSSIALIMVDDNEEADDSDIEEQTDDSLLHNCLLHQLEAHLLASVLQIASS
jgi:hypothetical protein